MGLCYQSSGEASQELWSAALPGRMIHSHVLALSGHRSYVLFNCILGLRLCHCSPFFSLARNPKNCLGLVFPLKKQRMWGAAERICHNITRLKLPQDMVFSGILLFIPTPDCSLGDEDGGWPRQKRQKWACWDGNPKRIAIYMCTYSQINKHCRKRHIKWVDGEVDLVNMININLVLLCWS